MDERSNLQILERMAMSIIEILVDKVGFWQNIKSALVPRWKDRRN